MSGLENIKSELKRSKGKAFALGACVLIATWSWSGILFGNESEAVEKTTPNTSIAPPITPAVTPTSDVASATQSINIHSFEMAIAKLKTWKGPLGLHLDKPKLAEISSPSPQKTVETPVEDSFLAKAELLSPPRLSGTVLFENVKYALFEGIRVQEGDYFGRYFLERVRAREVDLLDGSRRLTVQLSSAPSPTQNVQ